MAEDKAGQPPGDGAMMKSKPNDLEYPTGLRFVTIMISIFATLFLVNLDKLIISTAIPKITDDFHSPNDVGWYGTAYLLTNASFQLVFGKAYKFFPAKTLFLISIVVFEVGSALCGAAPNSIAFIIGRAIAGLGAGGTLPGIMTILVYSVPMHLRPRYQGIFGAIFGLASALGPTVGGAFTTDVTWRWSFYINLPFGGLVFALVLFFFHMPEQPATKIPLKQKLKQINGLSCLCIVPGVVCLCLVLQWGGTTYSWSNGRIIALFVVAFALLIGFVAVQFWLKEQAMLPPSMFLQRSIASGFWTSICVGAHQTLFFYYLPIWFQAVKGDSPVDSGVNILAMTLPSAAVALANGQFISWIGYYVPSLWAGVSLAAIGAGMLTTLGVRASEGQWVGYQVLYGVGLGLASQAPNMAAQSVLPKPDIAVGTSLMFFGQNLFGAIFVSIGGNVLINQLASRLSGILGVSTSQITHTGATQILSQVRDAQNVAALDAYNDSLRKVFQVALIMACLTIPGAAFMEIQSVKKKPLGATGKPALEQKADIKSADAATAETVDGSGAEKKGSVDAPLSGQKAAVSA